MLESSMVPVDQASLGYLTYSRQLSLLGTIIWRLGLPVLLGIVPPQHRLSRRVNASA